MTEEHSVAWLLDLAIGAEKAALTFYGGLSERFAHLAQAAEVWRGMMQDEAAHIRTLEEIRPR